MDPQLASWLWTGLGFAGLLLLFLGLGVLQQILKTRTQGRISLDWVQIASYAVTAVNAVNQIHSVRPEGLTDAEWNDLRFKAAEEMVVAYAQSINIPIDVAFLKAVRGFIEAAVRNNKPVLLGSVLSNNNKAMNPNVATTKS